MPLPHQPDPPQQAINPDPPRCHQRHSLDTMRHATAARPLPLPSTPRRPYSTRHTIAARPPPSPSTPPPPQLHAPRHRHKTTALAINAAAALTPHATPPLQDHRPRHQCRHRRPDSTRHTTAARPPPSPSTPPPPPRLHAPRHRHNSTAIALAPHQPHPAQPPWPDLVPIVLI
ncbi:hypothetical protein EDB86DRAFT_3105833 [Lactarius hatsudake]|nr:hypothetical protein EDB86DRAFT_3105833 [Lactarius hatsudake]